MTCPRHSMVLSIWVQKEGTQNAAFYWFQQTILLYMWTRSYTGILCNFCTMSLDLVSKVKNAMMIDALIQGRNCTLKPTGTVTHVTSASTKQCLLFTLLHHAWLLYLSWQLPLSKAGRELTFVVVPADCTTTLYLSCTVSDEWKICGYWSPWTGFFLGLTAKQVSEWIAHVDSTSG